LSRILVVGDVNDDIVVVPTGPIRVDTDTPSDIRRVPGGSAANTAAWLGALDADVAFTGCVNVDDVERHTAALPGVDVHLQTSDAPTGTIVILVDGERRTMLTQRGANAHLDLDGIPDSLVGDHVHLTGHTMAHSDGVDFARFIARAASLGATVSVSPGSAAYIDELGAERFGEVIAGADVLFVSLAEGAALTTAQDARQISEALDFGTVVLTLGADGVLVNGERVPAVASTVVDPTGAGDSFCAGFLASWVEHGDAVEAARRGAAVAARAVGVIGARPPG
jgi:sugar/nucleoside kinase (ribokinase family)